MCGQTTFLPISLSQFKNDITKHNENPAVISIMTKLINVDFHADSPRFIFHDKLFGFNCWGCHSPNLFICEGSIKQIYREFNYYQIELKNGDMIHFQFIENELFGGVENE